jgi:alkanesulfonate monooxygenase SsuD/methylene tetrahydromethanopterin reductase-like flavin-dependent oxidoreductase (luciferase family)
MILGVGLGDTGPGDVSFSAFPEQLNIKKRAKMLDEAIEIVAGLWSGAPFSYHGEHYQVNEVQILPKPVQSPRIPIWVGGGYPLPGPVRRAARWDGSCLYRHATHFLSPDDLRELRAFVKSHRPDIDGYDIVVGGSERRADWDEERAYIRELAEAGMTWWVEYISVVDPEEMHRRIENGPLSID